LLKYSPIIKAFSVKVLLCSYSKVLSIKFLTSVIESTGALPTKTSAIKSTSSPLIPSLYSPYIPSPSLSKLPSRQL